MEKFASTSKLPRLVATMCIVLACCSTDEKIEIAANKALAAKTADAETDLLGKWTSSYVSILLMNFNGEMELKDVLVGWSGWPEQEADAKLESLEAGLRPAFKGDIIFKSDHTYESNWRVIPTSGKWTFSNNTLTLDAGPAGKTDLTVKLITSSTLEVSHTQSILAQLENVGDTPEISVMVGARITLTK